MCDLTIQIVNYHSKNEIKELLPQIVHDLENSELSYEINLLDNNSDEDLTELVELYPEKTHAYYSKKNLGFGRGHNLLATHANGTYLILMNPDIEFVTDECIPTLHAIIAQTPEIGAVSLKLLNPDKSEQVDHTVPWKDEKTPHPLDIFNWRKTNQQTRAASIAGAFFITRKELFDTLGGFDPEIFFYFEEIDLFFRMRQAGYSLLYEGSQQVIHSTSFSRKKFGYYQTSMSYFLHKHFPHSFWSKLFLFAVTYLPVYQFMQFFTYKEHVQENAPKNN